MKNIFLLMVSLAVLGGCAESSALIKTNSASMRTDVFEEITNDGIAPQGYSDLRVTATLKTHKPGAHAAPDIHGTPGYRLLLNIDGQAAVLQGSLQKENSEPMKLVDPEAGVGIRYWFDTNLRLKTGLHRIVVALPDDVIAVEKEITLHEGNENNLVLEPIYGTKPGRRGTGAYDTADFMKGIRSIKLNLNGNEM